MRLMTGRALAISPWRKAQTHLVVPVAEGAKYKAATGWGLHVVTVDWLHACVVGRCRFKPVEIG